MDATEKTIEPDPYYVQLHAAEKLAKVSPELNPARDSYHLWKGPLPAKLPKAPTSSKPSRAICTAVSTPPNAFCGWNNALVGVHRATVVFLPAAAERKLVLAHYMPWYESKAVSGQWGWHWTMNKFQPDKVVQGRRELASHYRPLIGAYDSNDPHALRSCVVDEICRHRRRDSRLVRHT